MNYKRSLFLLCLSVIFISGCINDNGLDEKMRNVEEQKSTSMDPVLKDAEPYLEPIETENIELRRQAAAIVRDCPSGDKTCHVNKIYRYVVENFKYYSDPRRDEFVQTPNNTILIGGGDCEDLTILLNSYLENIGIETYVILTDTHAYSLACDIDIEKLNEYVKESLTKQIAKDLGQEQNLEVVIRDGSIYFANQKNLTFSLDAERTYYYGGDGSILNDAFESMDIDYTISSSKSVNIYFVPTKNDFNLLSSGERYTHYPSCQNQNILTISDKCGPLTQYGGIVIQNSGSSNAIISLNMKFYFRALDNTLNDIFKNQNITSYSLGGKKCVVLDATAGKYGYSGYDATVRGIKKTAINTVTKKYYELV